MLNDGLFSTAFQGWRTPEWFLDLVREVAPIAYDPATTASNVTGARAWSFQRPGDRDGGLLEGRTTARGRPQAWGGGLQQDWRKLAGPTGLVFCNPPYGRQLAGNIDVQKTIYDRKGKLIGQGTGWAQKMAQHGGNGLYLVPARTETTWWRALRAWSQLTLFWSSPEYGSRIRFWDMDGKPVGTAPFPSCVFYRGAESCVAFARVFGPHGTLGASDPGVLRLVKEYL